MCICGASRSNVLRASPLYEGCAHETRGCTHHVPAWAPFRPHPRRSWPCAADRASRGIGAAFCQLPKGDQRGLLLPESFTDWRSARAASASVYERPVCAAKSTFQPSSPSALAILSISPAVAARPRLRTSPSRVSFTPDKRDSSRRLTPDSFCCSESSRAISASSRAAISAFPIRSMFAHANDTLQINLTTFVVANILDA